MKELLEPLKILENVNITAQDIRNILNTETAEDIKLEEDEEVKEHVFNSQDNKYTMYSLDYDIYEVFLYDDFQIYIIDI